MIIIEMNPRVSRSSALASKATGFPIARVITSYSIHYTKLYESLEMDGYNILLASNGEEALELMNSRDVDLIITDLRMPVMSGQELLKKIISSNPGLPVIISYNFV